MSCSPDRSPTSLITLFAAASTTDLVASLASHAPPHRASFGASSALARQIADGAPADVYISASPRWVAYLEERGALAGPARCFARNRLVVVAPAGSALASAPPADADALLARLGSADLLALADEGVPAGDYTRQSLTHLGLLARARPRLVGQRDVRAVLRAVEAGHVAAGFVYASDARAARVVTLFAVDPASHAPIELYVAALRGARDPAGARAFVEALCSPQTRPLLERAGFLPPELPSTDR